VKHATFVVPGDLETPTGGYTYDRRVVGELRGMGWEIEVIDIGDHFPRPTWEQCAEAQRLLEAAPTTGPMIIDGLALGAMPKSAAALARTHKLIALVHHPLAMETGLSRSDAAALRVSECAALAATRHVIANSAFTANALTSDYEVKPQNITIAEPGTDRADWATGSGGDTVQLLTVGAVVPRKGYDLLVAALADLADLPWRLDIVGDTTRSPQTVAQIRSAIAEAGLGERILLAGALPDDALERAYRFADLFVLASQLEGYGMAAAGAIAHGLPLVATRGGALVDTIAESGMMVAADDVPALSAALRKAIADPQTREQLRTASRGAAARLPTWRHTAEKFVEAIEAAA
jgi:glycosyltransferase involved in cell wall biosynthesis